MIETVFSAVDGRFVWTDVTGPSPGELKDVAARYGLHPLAVADCLDPEHLPKLEKIGETSLLMLRTVDERAGPAADTVNALTRKIAIFQGPGFLLTVHRAELGLSTALKGSLPEALAGHPDPGTAILVPLISAVVETYWKPIEDAEVRITRLEEGLFEEGRDRRGAVHEIFHLKRRVGVIRAMARHTLELIQRLKAPSEEQAPFFHDLREGAQSLYFAADETLEDVTTLLSTQLAVSAQRTNEVMRLLTVMSVFFMPLTFIVGVYGMNFEKMPELRWPLGYPAVLALMAVVAGGIFLFFRRKGWLSRG